jgi:hypothetical protein
MLVRYLFLGYEEKVLLVYLKFDILLLVDGVGRKGNYFMNILDSRSNKVIDGAKYVFDEKTKIFSTNASYLIIDFGSANDYTFRTGSNCTFKTGSNCTFKTGDYCKFDTDSNCTFKTGQRCTFNTGHTCTFDTANNCTFITGGNCTFKTGQRCTFNTANNCTFTTGSDCTFKTGSNCTFDTSYNCVFKVGADCVCIRSDIKYIIEIPLGKKIRLNGYMEPGFFIEEVNKEIFKEVVDLDGKIVEIDGEKYIMKKSLAS